MRRTHLWACTSLALLFVGVALQADTLWTRDGRRLEGVVVAMREGVVEFEVRRGMFGRDRVRVDRADIDRIEFDRVNDSGNRYDNNYGSGGNGGGNSGGGYNGSTGRPGGMRERDVTVRANVPWQDTGITLRAGQTIYFNATGRVRWGPGRQDGPQGERNSPRNDARPIPSRPAAALIGRIDDDLFFIGDDDGAIRMRSGGRLYLGVNDDMLGDNSGAFQVTIYY